MTNRTYPSIAAVTSGLIWCVDASQAGSYPIAGGTIWSDISGSGSNLTLVNGASYDNSLGASIQFNVVSSQYAITTTIPSVAITNITVQVFAYVTLGTKGTIFKAGNNNRGYAFGIGAADMDTVGNNVVGLFPGIRWIPTGVSYGSTGWHLVSMVLNATSVCTMYLDGVAINTPTGANPGAPTTVLQLANSIGDSTRYFTGKIGAAFMYNRALSAAEILTTYNSLAIRFGLIGQP